MKAKEVVVSTLYILVVYLVLHFATVKILGTPFSPISITGNAVLEDGALLTVTITANDKHVYIDSPENITYNFSREDLFIIPLNATADFSTDAWRYSLYDNEHSLWVYQDISFTPNSTITAVRWSNTLTVQAHEVDGGWHSAQVTFYVHVNDSAPLIGNISDEIFVCEGESLVYIYNATDYDEEQLTSTISSPNPFFVSFYYFDYNMTTFFRLISGRITKANVGGIGGVSQTYHRTISVVDSVPLIDTAEAYITAIEVNNEPVINNQLGAQTIWTRGENSTFYHQYNVSDTESGETNDSNLNFSLSFSEVSNVFEIDSTYGIMNFTPTEDLVGDIYYITACVEDEPMSASHENFSVCEEEGLTNLSWVVCDNFSITVTDTNRAPEILNYTPYESNFTAHGTNYQEFYVYVKDADGTIPDIDWYVDGNLVSHNENLTNHTLNYAFPCDVSGLHFVEIVTTDGLLNDTFRWNVTVELEECPTPSSGGGGGGNYCYEDWQCGDWDVCQNTKRSYEAGLIAVEDYNYLTEVCAQNGYDDERFCGFQIKSCSDINDCQNTVIKIAQPSERQVCYYTENPSCDDGITNCHDGACETLTDCGGPCGACPTCSDKIQNQGESGVDCGGPCPYSCEIEIPFNRVFILLLILAGLALSVIIVYLSRLVILFVRKKKQENNLK